MSILKMQAFLSVQSSIDRMRRDLIEIHPITISTNPELRDRAAKVKSWTHVWLAAALEEYLKRLMEYVLNEIASQAVHHDQLKLSLFTIVCGNHFNAVRSTKGLPSWQKRLDALFPIDQATPVSFASTMVQLDGRTIRGMHFKMIWQIFGFQGDHLPTPVNIYEAALETMANGRNDIAHGEVDPITFGRGKVVDDVKRMVDQIEDATNHITLAADDYLTNNRYLR